MRCLGQGGARNRKVTPTRDPCDTNGDDGLLKKVSEVKWAPADRFPGNHFTRATVHFEPGKSASVPGFADDQEYTYYSQIARSGGLTEPVAWRLIFSVC